MASSGAGEDIVSMSPGDISGQIILALNSGSSSLKLGVFECGGKDVRLLMTGSADGIGRDEGSLKLVDADKKELLKQEHMLESQEQALRKLAEAIHEHLPSKPATVGHRIVHGGPHLREHQAITPDVIAQLQASVHFAPLHIPPALRLIELAQKTFPQALQVACFDTAFHATMPERAAHLPLPAKYYEAGVKRYGFHGLSCESVMARLVPPPARVVIAHLGNGSSVTAVQDGKSVDTSMGMSPTGGVPMSTRTGDLDPSVLLYLLRTEKLDADALEKFANHDCGLAGLSGGESDMQALLQRESMGDASAALAVDVFVTDVRKAIGSYAALMGGVDLLVFTGGIGEHSKAVRARILDGLECVGLRVDGTGTGKVSVLPAQEELQIARHCAQLMCNE